MLIIFVLATHPSGDQFRADQTARAVSGNALSVVPRVQCEVGGLSRFLAQPIAQTLCQKKRRNEEFYDRLIQYQVHRKESL
jgi:hypothetical protein